MPISGRDACFKFSPSEPTDPTVLMAHRTETIEGELDHLVCLLEYGRGLLVPELSPEHVKDTALPELRAEAPVFVPRSCAADRWQTLGKHVN